MRMRKFVMFCTYIKQNSIIYSTMSDNKRPLLYKAEQNSSVISSIIIPVKSFT